MVEQKSGIDYNWEDRAACRNLTQKQKEDFFPIKADGNGKTQIRRARKVCLECPVLYECLHAALVTNEKYGVWGMSSPKQRMQLRRHKDVDGNPSYLDIKNIPGLYEKMIQNMTIMRGGEMIEL